MRLPDNIHDKILSNIPEEVKLFMEAVEAQGHPVFLVGGSVRDLIVDRKPKDYDLAVGASQEALERLATRYSLYKLGRFGTYAKAFEDFDLEITAFRKRTEAGLVTGGDIYTDLACRDFTVNAMAFSETTGLVDPFGGFEDLYKKRIAAMYPEAMLAEDPIRALRAVRLSAELGAPIDEVLSEKMMAVSLCRDSVSGERLRDELFKILVCAKAADGIRNVIAYDLGASFLFHKLLKRMRGYDQQNPYHNKTLLEHSLTVLENVPERLTLRLAALFHDVGKPDVQTVDSVAHYYGHELASAELAQVCLKELKCSGGLISEVCKLIEAHMFNPVEIGEKGMKRLLVKMGSFEALRDLIDLMKGDLIGTAYPERASSLVRLYEMTDRLEQAETVFSRKDLMISGNDLMALGIREGKEIGWWLDVLLGKVMDSELENEKNQMLGFVQACISAENQDKT